MTMNKLVLICCIFAITSVQAQSDVDQIKKSVNDYLEGTSYSKPDQVSRAFYEEANLFLSHKDKPIWIVPIKEYVENFVANKEKGVFNGREGKILAIDINNDIATAKTQIVFKKSDMTFIDLFLLKKIEGAWKIISKAATRTK